MKRTFLLFLLFLTAMSFLPRHAFAGAWTVPRGRIWGEYYMKWQGADEEFGDDFKKKKKGKRGRSWDFVMEPKLELGLTDWLNFLWSIEYKESHYKEYDRPDEWGSYTRKNNGINYVKLGSKVRFLEEPFVFSGQAKFFIYPGYGINHGDDPEDRYQPAIGDGDDAIELRALAGKSFEVPLLYRDDLKLPCYIGMEAGYRWRSSAVCNDIPLFIETGAWPFKWLLIKTELDTVLSVKDSGGINKDYMIWRIGPVLQLLGDSVLREGGKVLNVEFQYGMTVFGRKFSAYQELVLKIQVQF